MSSSYSRGATWNTLLQPFYILSTVIGVLIGSSVLALGIRGCVRRRIIRTRFARAVDAGWAVPVFNVSNEVNNATLEAEAKNATGPKPVMRESVLDVRHNIHHADPGMWEQALPLSMVLLPEPTTQPHDLLLYLLRSPSILTSNLFSRLRAIQYVRSEQPHHHHPRVLPPTSSILQPSQASRHPSAERQRKTSASSTSLNLKHRERTTETFTTEPAQVMFVIAMPNPPHQRHSPATAHEPAIPIASQELCIGAVSASLQVPIQYLKGGKDDRNDAIRHGAAVQETVQEEDEGDYASTMHTRRVMSEDPGHEFAGSFVSSRHMYVGNYGDEESSYIPHRSATASPSFWDDHAGAGAGADGGGSTHETHNSYLAPPSFSYRPSARSHGHGDASSFENQQRHQHQANNNDNARSFESSSYYSPSRAYTPSIISADAGAAAVASTSAPAPIPALSPSPAQPLVVVSDLDQSPAPASPSADLPTSNGQTDDVRLEPAGLQAHRVSRFTSGTDTATTASATDVEGGYEADADGARRLTIRPKGAAARRRAGS